MPPCSKLGNEIKSILEGLIWEKDIPTVSFTISSEQMLT
jgi:hypothetical protein